MKLICLHGFLGSPKDFDFLKKDYSLYAPELDSLVHQNCSDILTHLSNELEKDTVLVGYSFGARLAMQVFLQRPSAFKKLVLFAGHMGIENEADKVERRKFEILNINKLQNQNIVEYIEEWNGLGLFKEDLDISYTSQNSDISSLYFSNWGLSLQPYMRDELLKYRDEIHIYYGENDIKYCNYAKENLQQFDIRYLKNVGHRIIQHEKLVLEELDKIIC